MNKTIIGILWIITAALTQAVAQDKEPEIGIAEHLGNTIPLDLTFYNENSDTVTLRSLINKPTILSFVYFDCPGLCSPLLSGIADVVSHTDMKLGKDYDIITISFNTQDTPEKAREKKQNFVQKIGTDSRGSWKYLTGELHNIQAITEAVGFKYKPMGVDFSHPSAIIVVSPEGKITRYLYGLNYLPFDLKMAVIEAKRGEARPTITKVLDFCFAYDIEKKSYALQTTRIIGIVTILMIIAVATIIFFINRKSGKQA